jgi:hypothetical protein
MPMNGGMSTVGSSLEASMVQAAQAQQVASKARDRERAASERGRRLQDQVELRVAGVESADAIRKLPQNDSEQAEAEQRSGQPYDDRGGFHVDVQA